MSQVNVSQPDVLQGLKLPFDLGNVSKESICLIHGHIQNVCYVFPFILNLLSLPIISFTFTNLTGDIYIGKKMHLYFNNPISFASLTSSPSHIEAESSGPVSPHLRLRKHGKKVPYRSEDSGIGGRIGSGGSANRGLIDADHLIDVLNTCNPFIF